VTFQAVAIAASQDLFELTPGDDKPIVILGIDVGQSSQEGDALEDYWRWSVVRGHTTSGSGGSVATPRSTNRSDGAAGFTAEVNNTTKATVGTTHVLHAGTFNIRAGLLLFWTPETYIHASQTDTTLVVRLDSTPDASTTTDGTLYVGELG
jgi:hypothetical protein